MNRFILISLLLLNNLATRANKDTLLLGSYVGYTPPFLYWLKADQPNESYTEAVKNYTENKFLLWDKKMAFTRGITHQAYWALLIVKDTSTSTHNYLWSQYVTSCKYEFYELDSSLNLIHSDTSSTYQPLRERPYPVRSVSFPFTSSGGQTKFLLLKAQPTNTDVLYLDQDIATPEDFLQWEIGYTGLLNRYFGFFIFALLVNLLLFLFMRNKIYGWLSVYIFFLLAYNINDFSFDVLVLPSRVFETFVLIPKFTWIIGATFSSLLVFNLFTDQQKHFPGWYRVSRFFIRLLAVLFPVCLLSHVFIENHQDPLLIYTRFTGYILLAAAMLFQIINLLYISIKKNSAGLFFLVSSGPLIISAFIYFFYLLTSINVFVIWPSNVMNACGFEVILLTIIFIYDYRKKNKDRNRLLEELLVSERKISTAVLKTQEQERKRIAEDLHDELGSSLAALKLRLQKTGLQQPLLDELLTVVNKASEDTRNISHNLMPPEFEKTTLHNLLSGYFAKLNTESAIHFQYHLSGEKQPFSKEEELVIYRIIMELSGNILKHSGATEASIQLIFYEGYLEIMAEDNGRGLPAGSGDGIGLRNIQSRVNYLDGELRIDTGNNGTTIMIQIPFKTT